MILDENEYFNATPVSQSTTIDFDPFLHFATKILKYTILDAFQIYQLSSNTYFK